MILFITSAVLILGLVLRPFRKKVQPVFIPVKKKNNHGK